MSNIHIYIYIERERDTRMCVSPLRSPPQKESREGAESLQCNMCKTT